MTRPPNDRGQGRKPISKSGELMKSRPVRMTDAQWEACKALGGAEFLRAHIDRMARRNARPRRPAPGTCRMRHCEDGMLPSSLSSRPCRQRRTLCCGGTEAAAAPLDLAVAKAEGHSISVSAMYGTEVLESRTGHLVSDTDYSTNWNLGGKIIERERIEIQPGGLVPDWFACVRRTDSAFEQVFKGATPLIAAMRAYVASKA